MTKKKAVRGEPAGVGIGDPPLPPPTPSGPPNPQSEGAGADSSAADSGPAGRSSPAGLAGIEVAPDKAPSPGRFNLREFLSGTTRPEEKKRGPGRPRKDEKKLTGDVKLTADDLASLIFIPAAMSLAYWRLDEELRPDEEQLGHFFLPLARIIERHSVVGAIPPDLIDFGLMGLAGINYLLFTVQPVLKRRREAQDGVEVTRSEPPAGPGPGPVEDNGRPRTGIGI